VQRDVKFVENEAKIVLTISGNEIVYSSNPDGLLWIIAVIGPGHFEQRFFGKALLCEIGMWETRPYHKGEIIRKGKRINLPRRLKLFELDKEQYLLVAPKIFSLLQEITDEKVSKRQRGPSDPFLIKAPNLFYFAKNCAFANSTSMKPRPQTIRFSASKKDRYLTQDIFCSELRLNEQLHYQLSGMTAIVNKALARHKIWTSSHIEKLKVVKEIRAMLSSYRTVPKYLLPEMMKKDVPNDYKKIPHWSGIVSDIIKWDGERTEEGKLADGALPDVQARIGSAQIRITIGLDGINIFALRPPKRNTQKDYIVFEINSKS